MGQILDWNELKAKIDRLKAAGMKIVFTNGCFDLIHIGHIRYLKEAKKLGDILVIGLNSDSSIKRLKPHRPIIPEMQRAEVLASLEMVDYVAIFSEDTPHELIKDIKPDILVKGGDWKKEDIVGSDIVPEIHSLSFIEGISTTDIIKKIKNLKD
ncbi:MAG: D-glycero-beta-D-manno-heptose 1-phosphate adenylyltransferase [Thermodesulfovibrionales bacterium]|nr:D-glycero-beta-D-manno-heptose 1-phosphate adenylyltransferase [Thermodesulfovibrionales bacterium]